MSPAFKSPCLLTTLKCEKGKPRVVMKANNEEEYKALLKENKGALFEMVSTGKVKAYLDVDYKVEEGRYTITTGRDGITRYGNKDEEFSLANLRKIIDKMPLFKDKPLYEMVRDARLIEKNQCKFSYRWVIGDVVFKNNADIKLYLESLGFKNDAPFDLSVYNDGRIMNSVYSTKDWLCDIPLLPAPFQKELPLECFLITCVDDTHPTVDMESIIPKPVLIEKKEVVKAEIDGVCEVQKVKVLLTCINADCPYKNWLEILMAIKSILNDSDEAYTIADEWSATGASYDSRVFGRTWNSIKDLGKFTIGTLIFEAKKQNPEKFKTDFVTVFKQKIATDFDNIYKLRDYEKIKTAFETRVCKITDSIRFIYMCDNEKVQNKTRKDLKETYENIIYEVEERGHITEKVFINKWFIDPKMKQYRCAVNLPPPLITPPDTLNLWTPFPLSLKNDDMVGGEFKTIEDHLFLLCGKSKECAEHTLKTFAYKLQFPAYKTRIMMIFVGAEGTGKNLFYDALKKVFGVDKCLCISSVARKLFGDFAHSWADKQIVVLNDFNPAEIKKENSEKLKDYITETDIILEKKNINEYEGNQYAHFIAYSQSYTPVANNSGSRRFFQMECATDMIGNKEYFQKIIDWTNNEANVYAWFKHLMSMDLTDFNPADFPITEVSLISKMANASPIETYIEDKKGAIIKQIEYKKVGEKGDILKAQITDEGAFPTLNHDSLFSSFKSWSCGNVPDYQSFMKRKFQLEMYKLRMRLGLDYHGDNNHPKRSYWKIVDVNKWVAEEDEEEDDD